MAAWLRFAGQRVSQPRWAGASRVVLGLAAAVVCLMSSSSVPAVAQ